MLIQRYQPAVQRSDVDLALVKGHAAIHNVAADEQRIRARHHRVIGPANLSGLRGDGVHDAPRSGDVEDTVVHQRRCFKTARSTELAAPRETKLAHRMLVDLSYRAETLVVVGAPVHRPTAGVLI